MSTRKSLNRGRFFLAAVLALAFAATLEAREIEIRGRLADAAGAEILLVPMAGSAATLRAGWSLDDRTAVTDDDGRALLPRAEGEHHYVAGAADGHYVYAELAPPETAPAEIGLRPLAEARVVDADGRPAPGFLGFFERPHEAFGDRPSPRDGARGNRRRPGRPSAFRGQGPGPRPSPAAGSSVACALADDETSSTGRGFHRPRGSVSPVWSRDR